MRSILVSAALRPSVLVFGACVVAHFSLNAQTRAIDSTSETVITASRIPQAPSLMPQGVWVITSHEILASGATTANEAIRWLGGVLGRIDSSGGRDQTLDIRGFGEASGSNIVFLVDGVRQNEGDQGGTSLSWLPVQSIERIEIARGSGTVMYGEGATAGVINIITNKGLTEPGGSVGLTLGSQSTREIRASVGTRVDSWRILVSGSDYETDNHRDNFRKSQTNGLLRATWSEGVNLLSFSFGGETGKGGLPGGISAQDFLTNPRKSYKPLDNGSNDSSRIGVNGEFRLGDWMAAFDLTGRKVNVNSNFVSDSFLSQTRLDSTRASVRSWRNWTTQGVVQKILIGADTERWNQDRNTNLGDTVVNQSSDAFFGRYEIGSQLYGVSGYVGVRKTEAQRQSQGTFSGRLDADNQSWDIGLAKTVADGSEIFARSGTSFRLANADEFSCYTSPFCPTNNVSLLRPQKSRDQELGFKQRQAWGQWSARLYRHALTDEIGIGSDQFSNINYDPTRRQGLELDVKSRITSKLDTALQFAHREAFFTHGSFVGNQVPLAPMNVLTARMSFLFSHTQTMSLTTQFVSSQRIAGDFDNTCRDNIAGYALVNARFSQKVNSWTLSASVNNLLDKRYYNLRTRCDPARNSIYPEVGRTLLFTLQNHF